MTIVRGICVGMSICVLDMFVDVEAERSGWRGGSGGGAVGGGGIAIRKAIAWCGNACV